MVDIKNEAKGYGLSRKPSFWVTCAGTVRIGTVLCFPWPGLEPDVWTSIDRRSVGTASELREKIERRQSTYSCPLVGGCVELSSFGSCGSFMSAHVAIVVGRFFVSSLTTRRCGVLFHCFHTLWNLSLAADLLVRPHMHGEVFSVAVMRNTLRFFLVCLFF